MNIINITKHYIMVTQSLTQDNGIYDYLGFESSLIDQNVR